MVTSHEATQDGESCEQMFITPFELASKDVPGSPRYR
jgi:hypothetical protein